MTLSQPIMITQFGVDYILLIDNCLVKVLLYYYYLELCLFRRFHFVVDLNDHRYHGSNKILFVIRFNLTSIDILLLDTISCAFRKKDVVLSSLFFFRFYIFGIFMSIILCLPLSNKRNKDNFSTLLSPFD